MNPFTRRLLDDLDDPAIREFVQGWDTLETLVISIYRAGTATGQDEADFATIRAHLAGSYPQYTEALAPYWPQAKAGGQRVESDPFLILLGFEHAGAFAGNWGAMQLLPALRESLNGWLLDQLARRAS